MAPEDLGAKIADVTDRYLQQKSLATKESRKEITKIMSELAVLFWSKVEKIITGSLDPNSGDLKFSPADLLVVDAGLLSERLIDGDVNSLKRSLLDEFSSKGDDNHYYLSELIRERHRQFIVYDKMASSDAEAVLAAKEESKYHGMTILREKIYARLQPFFVDLPGVSRESATFICSGKLDSQIESLSAQFIDTRSDALLKQRNQLIQIRDKVVGQVKARCQSAKELELIEGLKNLNSDIIKELIKSKTKELKEKGGGGSSGNESLTMDREAIEKSVNFLIKEVRLMKSLMSIGIIAGGMIHAQYVLLADQQRTNKNSTLRVMHLVKESDPFLPGDPDLVIAPYLGNGFFEWDHNSLIVSLTPMRAVEESVVSAVANYRILIDSLHNSNALRKKYEETFGENTFRTNFPKDYRDWILGVGKGKRDALRPNTLQFFKQNIGPNMDGVIVPHELNNISPTERGKLISLLNTKIKQGSKTFANYYTLAALYWQEAELRRATEFMEEAWKLNPKDGRVAVSAGLLQKKIGRVQKAEGRFEACITDAPNTIWRIYAQEELAKISQKYRDLK